MQRLLLLLPLATWCPAQAEDDPATFVDRHAGEDQIISLEEMRTALAELEMLVVVRRDLKGADHRLEKLRHQVAEQFEGDPASAQLREATLLGLIAHVELQLARGLVDDAWNEFSEIEVPAGDDDPEAVALAAIGADERVAALKAYVKARREGKAAVAPNTSPLVGLRPEHDEIEKAVEDALERGDQAFILQLGERAAPALARATMADLENLKAHPDPLLLLAKVHPTAGAALMREAFDKGGFFWKKRMIRALESDTYSRSDLTWDTKSYPGTCRISDYWTLLERLVNDPEVGNDAVNLFNPTRSCELPPELVEVFARLLASEDGNVRGRAIARLPRHVANYNEAWFAAGLSSPYAEVRREVASHLSNLPWSPRLARHVTDPDEGVRRAVAQMVLQRSATWINEKGPINTTAYPEITGEKRDLVLALAVDPKASVRALAVKAMKRMPSEVAILTSPIDSRVSAEVRQVIEPPPVEILRALAADPEPQIRYALAEWSRFLPPELGIQVLRLLCVDEDERTAKAAVYGLPVEWFALHPEEAFAVVTNHFALAKPSCDIANMSLVVQWMSKTQFGLDLAIAWVSRLDEADLFDIMQSHPQPSQWGHVDDELITLSPDIYIDFLTSLDRLPSKTPIKNMLKGFLRVDQYEFVAEQDKAAVLLAMNEERSEVLRVNLALDLAERSVPGWITAAVQGLRGDFWYQSARAYSKNNNTGQEFKAVLKEINELPDVVRREFAAALVHDRLVAGAVVELVLERADFFGRHAAAYARGVRSRWFEGVRDDGETGLLNGHYSRLLRDLIEHMGGDAELMDEGFLMRVLEDEVYAEFAMRALEYNRSPQLLPVLERTLRESPFTPDAARAAQALLFWPTEQHTELLLFAYENISDTKVQKAILNLLDAARQRAEILDFWRHRKALADSKDQAVAQLLALLEDESSAVRIQAIRGLATFDAVSAIPKLIPLLKSEERGVATATAEALEVLNRPRKTGSRTKRTERSARDRRRARGVHAPDPPTFQADPPTRGTAARLRQLPVSAPQLLAASRNP